MKKVQLTMIMAVAIASLTLMSCNGNKNDDSNNMMGSDMNHEMNHDMNHDAMGSSQNRMNSDGQQSDYKQVLTNYMALKDALVATDEAAAQKAGKDLESSLVNFNVDKYTAEQQKNLKDIIADATENAEHISVSKMHHQREHFKVLSKDIIDMVAITGTDNTIFELKCPMYDGGAMWLSKEKDIKNPYYGSKMMDCGSVEKVINK